MSREEKKKSWKDDLASIYVNNNRYWLYHEPDTEKPYYCRKIFDLPDSPDLLMAALQLRPEQIFLNTEEQPLQPTGNNWMSYLWHCYTVGDLTENRSTHMYTPWWNHVHFADDLYRITLLSVRSSVFRNNDKDDDNYAGPRTKLYVLDCSGSEELREFYIQYKLNHRKTSVSIFGVLFVSWWYHLQGKKMYRHFTIPKANGKVRDIYAPEKDVKAALRLWTKALGHRFAYDDRKYRSNRHSVKARNRHGRYPYQFAYLPGVGVAGNAMQHQPNYNNGLTRRYFWKTDISGFFDHCRYRLINKWVNKFISYVPIRWMSEKCSSTYGLTQNSLLIDALINPATQGLYQGSPASGLLSNLILRPAIDYWVNILRNQEQDSDYVVTVYADDITVSSSKPIGQREQRTFQTAWEFVCQEYELPFEFKEEKTKIVRDNATHITGVVINHQGNMTVPRSTYRMIRTCLHRLSTGQELSDDMSLSRLEGLISWAWYIESCDNPRFVDPKSSNIGSILQPESKIKALVQKYHSVCEDFNITLPRTLRSKVA